jgi:hypothetical protein
MALTDNQATQKLGTDLGGQWMIMGGLCYRYDADAVAWRLVVFDRHPNGHLSWKWDSPVICAEDCITGEDAMKCARFAIEWNASVDAGLTKSKRIPK